MTTNDELLRAVRRAADHVHKSNREYTTLEDLTQEAHLWLLEHPGRVTHNTLPDGSVNQNRLTAELVRHLIRVAETERTETLGLSPTPPAEQVGYTRPWVELLLPAVFIPGWRPEGVEDAGDPGDSWRVMVTDLSRAVAGLGQAERDLLFTRVVGGWSWRKFAEVGEGCRETWRCRYHRVVDKLVGVLNKV